MMQRWISYCQRIKKNKEDSKKTAKKKKRVDGSAAYELNEPTDSSLDSIKLPDPDSFPNIRECLTTGCITPIGSTEGERAASGVRRLQTPYRSTMREDRESDLNFLQLQSVKNIDLNEVKDIFIDLHPRRMFHENLSV